MTRAAVSATPAMSPDRPTGRWDVPAGAPPAWLAVLVGLSAIGFSAVYLASDILEVGQGHFSTFRLALTYAGEAAIPFFVLGLYAQQRPRIGRLGLFGAVAYAYSYVFFTSTVVYALVAHTPDYQAVTEAFGSWMVVHGVVMVIGGVAFGIAVLRARIFPDGRASASPWESSSSPPHPGSPPSRVPSPKPFPRPPSPAWGGRYFEGPATCATETSDSAMNLDEIGDDGQAGDGDRGAHEGGDEGGRGGGGGGDVEGGVKDRDHQDARAAAQVEPGQHERAR